jgi:hypothetical protein
MRDMLKKRSVQCVLVMLLGGAALLAWRGYEAEEAAPAFSGEQALAEVRLQVAFGPRAPGSAGHRRARTYFADTLRALADRVRLQSFTYDGAGDSSRAQTGTNIIASFTPEARERVLLAAHYDTRPAADEDPDAAKRGRPVPGANDGASGVAVLLELARLFERRPPDVGVDLVLFDLEDMGESAAQADSTRADSTRSRTPFAIGARHFAERMEAAGPSRRPDYGILLDMVCDRNLRIPKEGHSLRRAPAVVEKVWTAAREVGASAFVEQRGPAIMDDHVPLLDVGIPMVDLIHAPFPWYWHTTMDTPAQCSAASLDQVGEVVANVVYGE